MDKGITVAIPLYNGAKYIKNALQSIFNQTTKVNHIIVVDDNSNDHSTEEVMNIIKLRPDYDIRYYRNSKNLGYPVNWNKCFEYCTTKFLVILHQDDKLVPNAIHLQVNKLLENDDLALTGGQQDLVRDDGLVFKQNGNKVDKLYEKGQIYEFVTEQKFYIPCSSVMFNMEKINQTGYFETNVLGTDEHFWPRVLTKFPIAVLGSTLIHRTIHPGQAEWSDFYHKHKEIMKMIKRYQRFVDYEQREELREELLQFLTVGLSETFLLGIAQAVIRNQKSSGTALFYLYNGVRLNPLLPFTSKRFWKVVSMGVFNQLGILEPLRAIRNQKTDPAFLETEIARN